MGRGVNFKNKLYRAMGSGFNCNLDITRYFPKLLATYFYIRGIVLTKDRR